MILLPSEKKFNNTQSQVTHACTIVRVEKTAISVAMMKPKNVCLMLAAESICLTNICDYDGLESAELCCFQICFFLAFRSFTRQQSARCNVMIKLLCGIFYSTASPRMGLVSQVMRSPRYRIRSSWRYSKKIWDEGTR